MISVNRLVTGFKNRLHHRNSNYSQALDIEEICEYLNEAQYWYIQNRIEQEGRGKLVKDDLRPFEENNVSLDISKEGNNYFATFKDDHYQIIRQKCFIDMPICGVKEVKMSPFRADNFNEHFNNTMWKSSYYWEDVMYKKDSKGFEIEASAGFELVKVLIDYYRKPLEIAAPSLSDRDVYRNSSGDVISQDQGLELDTTFAHLKIMDLAVLYALRDLGDIKDWQTQQSKIINSEKFYS